MAQEPECISEEEAAYHEAGHVVVAYQLGHQVETVSIVRDLEKGGYCNPFVPAYVETNNGSFVNNRIDLTDFVKTQLAVLAAGYIAQERQFPSNVNGVDSGSQVDFQSSQDLCIDVLKLDVKGTDKDKFEKMVGSAYAMASVVLGRNWPAFELVAKELLKRKILDGTQLEKIMKKAPPGANHDS